MLCTAGEPWADKHRNQRQLSSCAALEILLEDLAEFSVDFLMCGNLPKNLSNRKYLLIETSLACRQVISHDCMVF